MPIILKDIEPRVRSAVKHYWGTLTTQAERQGAVTGRTDTGNRNAVTGGKQMDGFCELLMGVLADNGITTPLIHRHSRLEIPGYFRPTKKWDMLIFHDGVLLAVNRVQIATRPIVRQQPEQPCRGGGGDSE